MRISERGQITIPKKLRDRFGLTQGAELEIAPVEDGLLIRMRKEQPEHPFQGVVGILPPAGIVDELGGVEAYIREIRGG